MTRCCRLFTRRAWVSLSKEPFLIPGLLFTRIVTDSLITSQHIFNTNVTLKYNMKHPYQLNKYTKNIGERNHA